MYNVSNAFRQAVAAGKPQIALLIFDDAVFSNSDINVDNGIELNDYFNTEEDLAIGQALSNELHFSLFNDDRLLNDYEFGEFIATVGVQTSTETFISSGNVTLITNRATYVGSDTSPYLTRNGSALSSPPNFAVKTLLMYDGKVYAFGANGQYAVYRDSNGSNITGSNEVNAFMRRKGSRMSGTGATYNNTTRILDIWRNGQHEQYEFAPFGKFIAERPNVPDVIQIDFTCNDFMTKFDVDMPSNNDLGISYPVTYGNLFTAMCNYLGVSYTSNTFINSTASLTKRPTEFGSATMREVLQWLAEAACSVARFNRDGRLVLDWIRTTNLVLTENNYKEFGPYWYETKQIDMLCNRNTESGEDRNVGSGENGYLIQDNPLLKGVHI